MFQVPHRLGRVSRAPQDLYSGMGPVHGTLPSAVVEPSSSTSTYHLLRSGSPDGASGPGERYECPSDWVPSSHDPTAAVHTSLVPHTDVDDLALPFPEEFCFDFDVEDVYSAYGLL